MPAEGTPELRWCRMVTAGQHRTGPGRKGTSRFGRHIRCAAHRSAAARRTDVDPAHGQADRRGWGATSQHAPTRRPDAGATGSIASTSTPPIVSRSGQRLRIDRRIAELAQPPFGNLTSPPSLVAVN